jgi:hypothetical protein
VGQRRGGAGPGQAARGREGVAVRHGLAAGGRRRREKEKGEKKRKERKGKRKGEKEKEKKEKEGKENRKREGKRNKEKFRKFRKIVRKLGEGFLRDFTIFRASAWFMGRR